MMQQDREEMQESALAGGAGTMAGGAAGATVGAAAGIVGWGVGMIGGGLIGLVAGVFLRGPRGPWGGVSKGHSFID
jgi:hypothetical protein